MIRERLYQEYLDAAREFGRRGPVVDSLACAALALRLKPDSEEVRRFIATDIPTAQPGCDGNGNEDLVALRKWKARLDQALFGEIAVSDVSPQDVLCHVDRKSAPPDRAGVQAPETIQRFQRLTKRFDRRKHAKARDIRHGLRDLLTRLTTREEFRQAMGPITFEELRNQVDVFEHRPAGDDGSRGV